jgi:[acyl-carrier-protein] S-malonyltransferase
LGKELYENSRQARQIFALADNIKPDTTRLCFEGTMEELSRTQNAQPCLFCVEMAAAAALSEEGVFADVAGVFRWVIGGADLCRAIALKRLRADMHPRALMQKASDEAQSSMALFCVWTTKRLFHVSCIFQSVIRHHQLRRPNCCFRR